MDDMEKPTLSRSPHSAEEFQLMPDPTPRLSLPPDDPVPQYTEEQIEYIRKKEKATRCKIISMDEMNIPFHTNTTYIRKGDKTTLLGKMEEWFVRPDEEVTTKFNDICTTKLLNFEDPAVDYTKYAIYKTTIPS